MINRYKKGQRVQQRAKRFYESLGYQVEVVRYDKWRSSKDFFGLWDLICVGPHDVKFVQVKSNKKPDKKWQEKAREWRFGGKTSFKEWVVYKDYQRGDTPSTRVTLEPHS